MFAQRHLDLVTSSTDVNAIRFEIVMYSDNGKRPLSDRPDTERKRFRLHS